MALEVAAVRLRDRYIRVKDIVPARVHRGKFLCRRDRRCGFCRERHGREHAQHHDEHQQNTYQSLLHKYLLFFRAALQDRPLSQSARAQFDKKPVQKPTARAIRYRKSPCSVWASTKPAGVSDLPGFPGITVTYSRGLAPHSASGALPERCNYSFSFIITMRGSIFKSFPRFSCEKSYDDKPYYKSGRQSPVRRLRIMGAFVSIGRRAPQCAEPPAREACRPARK